MATAAEVVDLRKLVEPVPLRARPAQNLDGWMRLTPDFSRKQITLKNRDNPCFFINFRWKSKDFTRETH